MKLVMLSTGLISTLFLIQTALSQDQCRQLDFKPTGVHNGTRLINHLVHTTDVTDESFCRLMCYLEPNCISFNFMRRMNTENHYCELSNSTYERHEADMREHPGYLYREAENFCGKNLCTNGATCQTGFTHRGYRCWCPVGFEGENCERGVGKASRCKDIYNANLFTENKAYKLHIESQDILVYCHMNDTGLGACGGGGWTLVMKIDGTQSHLHYDSSLWSNKETFNLSGGATGVDRHQTKLPTFWGTSFTKICLGMRIEQQINFVVINKTADSMFSLIADGQYRNTSLGRDAWKALIGPQASLQHSCNKEGFNVISSRHSKARIGILGNNEENCDSPDSRIAFGGGGRPDDTNTCGNAARHGGDNGDKNTKTMGYILVQ